MGESRSPVPARAPAGLYATARHVVHDTTPSDPAHHVTTRTPAATPSRRAALAAALALGTLLAVGIPGGELWLDCRVPDSEACIWGKALWPVSFALGALVGSITTAVTYLAMRAWQKRAHTGRR